VPSRARLFLRMLPALANMARLRPDGRRTVVERFESHARRHPERAFLLFQDQRIGYAEMNRRANRVAHWGLQQGWRRGDVVALLMENRPEYLATWLGLAKLGVPIALLNTHAGGKALAHALEAAGARALIVGSESECMSHAQAAGALEGPLAVWVARDPEARELAALPAGASDLDAALARQTDANPDPSARAGLRCADVLFYIYTSGTTGLPKAARFSHQRFLQGGDWERHALRLRPGDVHYCALPLYHSAGGALLVSSVISAGATLALRRSFSATHFWDDVRRFDVTCFQYIGELCRYLLNQPPRPDDRDHRVRAAMGNGLRAEIWETFQRRFGIRDIVEFYGSTEGNAAIANLENRPGSLGRYPMKAAFNGRLIRCDVAEGRPLRDARGRCIECAPGETGELVGWIAPHHELTGHFEGYTSEEATEHKLLRDAFADGDAWFRTGDLMRQDADGFFYFVDRIGDTFRWKSENVSTQEVEEVLSEFPGVATVNVYGVAVPGAEGRAGMAAIVARDSGAFDAKALYRFVEEALPCYAAPLFVRLVKDADLTGTLKLRKVRLREEGFDPATVADRILLRDDEACAYVPLTRERCDEIVSGRGPRPSDVY
jgi:fatty-acyl-CoA synthase